jgi:hypothetical protein
MGSRRARPKRRRRWPVLVVVLLLAAAVAAFVWLRPAPTGTPAAPPTPSPTALRDVDLTKLPISRTPFCELVKDRELTTALGGRVARTAHYDNGERAELAPGVTDVSHEYNCSFYAADGTLARAWVFAAPTRPGQARALVHTAAQEQGCRTVHDAPAFGRPSTATVCHRSVGTEATMRGLFGDAWFSCQLTRARSAGLVAATERWCVHVAETVGARP